MCKPSNRRPDLFVLEYEPPGLQDRLHTEQFHIGYKPSFTREVARSPVAILLQMYPTSLYETLHSATTLSPIQKPREKFKWAEAHLNLESPDTLRFVPLSVPYITLQSRSYSIHMIVGRDNDVINFLSNKFSGVVEIRERGLDGVTAIGIVGNN